MTPTQKKATETNDDYRRYIETKSDKYVGKRLSLAYILFSVANSYCEEANERMSEYGLMHKKLKIKSNNLMQSFDAYDSVMRKLLRFDSPANVNHENIGKYVCEDYDIVKAACDDFMERGEAYKENTKQDEQ